MRRLDVLINDARRETDNSDYSSSSGIQQSEFIRSANDAQERLQSLILQAHSTGTFEKEKIIDTTTSEEVLLPDDMFLGSRIIAVFYSSHGDERDYYPLDQRRTKERIMGLNSNPEFYVRTDNKLILVPAPQSNGKIRIVYQKKLPKIDVRRGKVDSVTLTGNAITSLVLETANLEADAILDSDFMTVVDRRGVIKMANIPVDDIDELTGAVTIAAGFQFENGETILSGDFVVSGSLATSHCQMPDVVEKYLIEFMKQRVLKRDSSSDQTPQNAELMAMEQEIVAAFAKPDMDVDLIPILQRQYLDYEPY